MMELSFLVKPIIRYVRSDSSGKLELTPVPTDFFHLETGVNHVKTDGTVLAEYLEGVVDDSFLRDSKNAKAYAEWKKSLTVKPEESQVSPEILPSHEEVVLGDENK